MKANHKDKWVSIKIGRGTTEVFVKRGQFIFGRKTAAKALKMPERTVHKRMLKLKTMGNCDIQSDTHYSIVTINNYDIYQSTEEAEGTGKGTAKGQARDTNKNLKDKYLVKSKKKKTTSPPDPRVKEIHLYFVKGYEREMGDTYDFTWGKECAIIKDLLKRHTLEDICHRIDLFFKNEEAKRRGYDIGIFKSMFNRLKPRTTERFKEKREDLTGTGEVEG